MSPVESLLTANRYISQKALQLFAQSTTAQTDVIVKHCQTLAGTALIDSISFLLLSLYSWSGVIYFRILMNFLLKLKYFQLKSLIFASVNITFSELSSFLWQTCICANYFSLYLTAISTVSTENI